MTARSRKTLQHFFGSAPFAFGSLGVILVIVENVFEHSIGTLLAGGAIVIAIHLLAVPFSRWMLKSKRSASSDHFALCLLSLLALSGMIMLFASDASMLHKYFPALAIGTVTAICSMLANEHKNKRSAGTIT